MPHRKQVKEERESINIYFANYDTSMTIGCFDEDSEMSFIVRDGKQKAMYVMDMNEAKELKKWLTQHLKYSKETDIHSITKISNYEMGKSK